VRSGCDDAVPSIYKVKIERVGAWAKEQDLSGNQLHDAAKIDNKPGSQYTDRFIARLKGATGEVSGIARNSQGHEFVLHATPGQPGEHQFPNGERYRISVTEVQGPEKPTAVDLASAPVKPPRFTIERKTVGGRDGVEVTFQPTTKPAIFTIAPEGWAKPLGLPSFPFPQHFPDGQPRSRVSLFVPILAHEPPTAQGEGQPFLLAEHTHVRVGVRGAGLFVRGIPIPAAGAPAHEVAPEAFQYLAAQVDHSWLDASTIAQKYAEKGATLRYS
jgi:hypothetical protein